MNAAVRTSLDQIEHTGGGPLLCLEVNPPRGVDVESIFERLQGRVEGVDFFNVTDCALARLKLAALPFAALLKHRFGIEPMVNLSCRDRNVIALQADLLAAWVTGVRSVVALTGDAVSVGDSPGAKGVFEVNSIGLLNIVGKLNGGSDAVGHPLRGGTSFFSGVVVNPNARNINAEIKRLERKKAAGARYALSQPVFDEQASVEFFSQARSCGLPIFMGLLPLKTNGAAAAISKVPGIKISDALLAKLNGPEDQDCSGFFLDHCMRLAAQNREYVRGFHVISGATPKLGLQLIDRLVKEFKG